MKIGNRFIEMCQQHPDEAAPLVDTEDLSLIYSRRQMFAGLDRLTIKRNRFRVRIGMARFVPRNGEIVKSLVPHVTLHKVIRQFFIVLRQSPTIQVLDSPADGRMEAFALRGEEACGARAINGLMASARARGLEISLLGACNSADTAGTPERVVGYAAFALR